MELTRKAQTAAVVLIPAVGTADNIAWKISATLASGDVKVARHYGGVWHVDNITDLPVEIAGTGLLAVTLTEEEMTPDDNAYPVAVLFKDAAGSEWIDNALIIHCTANDMSNVILDINGLDAISGAAPAGVATNFREMVVQLWRRFFKKSTCTSTQLKTYADNGVDILTTQTVSDDSTTQTQGSAS
ncbi:MAG: hypothetical protein ABFD92_00085 [Planctomycetaceae bacterium]|nr:hypothetical protein [Planctomycetaceae bacterium]